MFSERFQLVSTVPCDETHNYKVYKPFGNPMILMSLVDGFPIASLHLECQRTADQRDYNNTRGKSLITHRPNKSTPDLQQFQGLVDRDDQEIQFVLTNLRQEGRINFNIMKSDVKVEVVDPFGLNEINEINPNRSVEVQCDQATKLALLLSTLKSSDSGKPTTTVKDDETTPSGPKGAYYYLSIVPQLGVTELETAFGQTKWITADLIIRKEAKPQSYPQSYRTERGIAQSAPRSYNFVDESGSRGLPESGMMSDRTSRGLGAVPFAFSASSSAARSDELSELCGDTYGEDGDSDDDGDGEVVYRGMSSSASAGAGGGTGYAFGSASVESHHIESSYASQIKGGRQIQVYSEATGVEYNYDLNSIRCVLGLSVAPDLKFEDALVVTPADEIARFIEEFRTKTYLDILKDLVVFKSDECVVSLEGKPDVVFYTCGHFCMKKEYADSVTKCPLCRKVITAKIPMTC